MNEPLRFHRLFAGTVGETIWDTLEPWSEQTEIPQVSDSYAIGQCEDAEQIELRFFANQNSVLQAPASPRAAIDVYLWPTIGKGRVAFQCTARFHGSEIHTSLWSPVYMPGDHREYRRWGATDPRFEAGVLDTPSRSIDSQIMTGGTAAAYVNTMGHDRFHVRIETLTDFDPSPEPRVLIAYRLIHHAGPARLVSAIL